MKRYKFPQTWRTMVMRKAWEGAYKPGTPMNLGFRHAVYVNLNIPHPAEFTPPLTNRLHIHDAVAYLVAEKNEYHDV